MLIFHIFLISTSIAQRLAGSRSKTTETYLTGSEFEATMVEELLNSTDLILPETDPFILMFETNLTYRLIDENQPFTFIERKYFWSLKSYENNEGNRNKTFNYVCVLNISNNDGQFSQINLPDGSPIQEIVFGCEHNKECCGMKCCGDDVLVNIIIVGVISVALLLLLLCNILIGFKKRRGKENRKNNPSAAYEVGRNGEGGEEIDTNQVTLHTRPPVNSGIERFP